METSEFNQKRIVLPATFGDLNDLLYHDAMIRPFVLTIGEVRGENDFGVIHSKAKDKLEEANLILDTESLFTQTELEAYEDMREYAYYKLKSRSLDVATRTMSIFAREKGINMSPRYFSKDFSEHFATGNTKLLSIICSQLPTLDPKYLEIDYLIDFLKDEETQSKRRRLFSWQNAIETKIESGEIKIEHVPDMIAERLATYINHLKLSEQKFKIGIYECLLNLPKNIILGLTLVGLPKALRNLLEFKKRELELFEAELKAPSREVAYIAHTHGKLSK